MLALEITGLEKTYRNQFTALKGIDLVVEEGDFFALLGPNGAGKSTTIGIITSLINKSSGKVRIFDADIDDDFSRAKTYSGNKFFPVRDATRDRNEPSWLLWDS